MDDPPDYINALGKPFPPRLQQQANDMRKAKGKKVKEVSMLELAAVESAEVDDTGHLGAPAASVARGEDTDEYSSDDESESGDARVPGSRFSVLGQATPELSMLERDAFKKNDDGMERPAGSLSLAA